MSKLEKTSDDFKESALTVAYCLGCRWEEDELFGYVAQCSRDDKDLIILDAVDYGGFLYCTTCIC